MKWVFIPKRDQWVLPFRRFQPFRRLQFLLWWNLISQCTFLHYHCIVLWIPIINNNFFSYLRNFNIKWMHQWFLLLMILRDLFTSRVHHHQSIKPSRIRNPKKPSRCSKSVMIASKFQPYVRIGDAHFEYSHQIDDRFRFKIGNDCFKISSLCMTWRHPLRIPTLNCQ